MPYLSASRRYHCRCNACGRRQVRRQDPRYTKGEHLKCRYCHRRTVRLDKWMQNRPKASCWCQGYWFPHRKGSYRCDNYLTDKEAFEERAAIMEYEGGLTRWEAEAQAAKEQPPRPFEEPEA